MVSIEFFDENVQYNQNPAHTFWIFWKNYILKVFYSIAKLFKMQFLQNTQKVCARFWLFCISSSKNSIETIRSNGGYREMDLYWIKNLGQFWWFLTRKILETQKFLFSRNTYVLSHNDRTEVLFFSFKSTEPGWILNNWSKSPYLGLNHKWFCHNPGFGLRAKCLMVRCALGWVVLILTSNSKSTWKSLCQVLSLFMEQSS